MKKILIIDDESYILLMLKKMLERAGYLTDIAANGEEGVELFKEILPDLVITDIIMPEKEGIETIREMLKLQPELKIITISGGGRVSADSYLDMARRFGASKIMSKPFTKSEMVSAVEELLGPGDLPLQQARNQGEVMGSKEKNGR